MGKGGQTRDRIVHYAVTLASEVGVSGLTLGVLADGLAMSKSGLFAHFGSKEELQLAVVLAAQDAFVDEAIRPALTASRGLARLAALFDGWLARFEGGRYPGGCPLLAAAYEFDDQPGAIRDALVAGQKGLRDTLAKAVALAVETGELAPDTDAAEVAFALFALVQAAHHDARLLDDARAYDFARRGYARLIASLRA
ncbi:TetR/AcrR family transcriptional regulator [Crenobacter cavernae]|uniref:TetR/AcrR family transcriptional regulator n=1 Tax=Crenobacter cavernae TaxID=2290923 RepID=A0ABY0FG54_9NEIS|nr:TetR/AcrR family transcriptional regulator [Crenobacter cavernae]RXZ44375.1 TetR/AcrR family transcriptional regulator [Crenobacter cavernae]